MNERKQMQRPGSKVVIAGGGPAGSSLAIRLARAGYSITLVERDRFPREKLCGEFISPECFRHFQELGVFDAMLSMGGDRIFETHFYTQKGRSTMVPTEWFGGPFSLSLSRSAMDDVLLRRAKAVGVEVIDEVAVTDVRLGSTGVRSAIVKRGGQATEVKADIFVDATGRARILDKLIARNAGRPQVSGKPGFIGFKAHLRGSAIAQGRCEIYSFPGGYAGLSNIEDGMANLCLIVKQGAGLDGDALLKLIGKTNSRGAAMLDAVYREGKWLAVAITDFGHFEPAAEPNLFAVGDSAGFIDPFTGSGMLMAFESAESLAASIVANTGDLAAAKVDYRRSYRLNFRRRFAVSRILRRAALSPNFAEAAVGLLHASARLRSTVARSTRSRKTKTEYSS
jgi:flavin-dependent dehydrogenase